ncbi:RNA pseudouridine synthase [Lacrimispora algidixylanolytica]|uniref:Pseudouridine synthase n=1 Tax=Lacrimispora algidixylanolytica TaxID=94868 RepID=A0A419T9U5_9FIRM|nr:RNA pseudouridine synthase [Lacrimispora algidixylanolytica]
MSEHWKEGGTIVDLEFIVTAEDAGIRIDRYLSDQCSQVSRSYLQKLLKEEAVLVNEKPVKSNYKVGTLDKIQLAIPEAVELEIEAEDMPLDIIYEDKDIILINKPKGMVVHPAAGHYSGTLVNGLMSHCKEDLSGINGVMRPGIVHRIDMDTTGALIVCKNDVAHNSIAEQLKEHSITRKYFAVVHGVLKQDEGTISAPIGRHPVDRKKMSINEKNGREAVTHYRVLERYRQFTYVECQLETGRTHQIRVHLASIGHPLLGDSVYGPAKSPYRLNGQTLHAGILGIIHPRTGEYMEFTAPLPDYFEDLLRKLRTT